MRKTIRNILIILSSLVLVFAISLLVYLTSSQNDITDKIVIKSNDEIHEVLEVSDLNLIPSEMKEYDVSFESKIGGKFFIYLDYQETFDGGMKDYVDVIVKVGDEVIYEGKLSDLFKDDFVVEVSLDFNEDSTREIRLIYSMDVTVGNEAKNTSSDFNIELTIKRNTGGE